MGRPKKKLSQFDAKLGAVVAARRLKADKMTQQDLASASGVPLSNLQRREDGTNEFTVSELERVANALDTTAASLAGEALADYGGIDKLIAEYTTSEGDATVDPVDNVTHLGRVTPPFSAAADTKGRTPSRD